MSKEKQIEEMKREINTALTRDCSKSRCLTCEFINEENCEPSIIAEHLYNAGYRKQSEVIRCKDCKYFYPYGEVRICRHWNCHATKDDACCSYAKMKGGAE